MAGGEKKRASEIERERASRAVAKQQAMASSQGVDPTSNSGREAGENEKNPAISNPHWEDAKGQAITKALVGDEVYLCADITDIADGAAATIKIVEKDADGKDDADSQKELAEKGYTLPEYAFTVECGGATSGESGVLEVRGWIKTQFKDEKTGKPISNHKYTIYLSDGSTKTGTTSSDGFVDEKYLKHGEYFIDFGE